MILHSRSIYSKSSHSFYTFETESRFDGKIEKKVSWDLKMSIQMIHLYFLYPTIRYCSPKIVRASNRSLISIHNVSFDCVIGSTVECTRWLIVFCSEYITSNFYVPPERRISACLHTEARYIFLKTFFFLESEEIWNSYNFFWKIKLILIILNIFSSAELLFVYKKKNFSYILPNIHICNSFWKFFFSWFDITQFHRFVKFPYSV